MSNEEALENLKKTKENDLIKENYCLNNGIEFLLVPSG